MASRESDSGCFQIKVGLSLRCVTWSGPRDYYAHLAFSKPTFPRGQCLWLQLPWSLAHPLSQDKSSLPNNQIQTAGTSTFSPDEATGNAINLMASALGKP